MKCDWDGGCYETVRREVCGCDGYAQFEEDRRNFEVLATIIYAITLTSNKIIFYDMLFPNKFLNISL